MTARGVIVVSLLAAIWGARGEPPGSASGGQITTGAVIHFGADSNQEYGKTSYDGVQGLRYFASPGANQLPGLQQTAFLVYPGSVISTNTLSQTPQIEIAQAPAPSYGYIGQSNPSTTSTGYAYGGQLSSSATIEGGVPHYGYTAPTSSSGTSENGVPHYSYTAQTSSSVTPSIAAATAEPNYSPSASGSLHQNVDITYDSLSSTNNYPTFTTPAPPSSPKPIHTSPPPMKATTYGPPKPIIIGPFLSTRHRPKTPILISQHHHLHSPKLHFHHIPHLHVHGSPKHLHPPGVFGKARQVPHLQHHTPSSTKKPPPQSHYPNSVSHPDITKAIFHSKPMDSYAAAAHIHQQPTVPYYLPVQSYVIAHHRSDEDGRRYSYGEQERNGLEENPEFQTTPVIVYKGVRPPVSVYQKPQPPPPIPMPPTTRKHDSTDSGNSLSSQYLGTVSSSSWMPINAPEGAVPARAYDIPAPDLSQGKSHYSGTIETDYPHHSSVSTIPVSNFFLQQPEDDEAHYGEVYKGESEGVVSAVVLVKQR